MIFCPKEVPGRGGGGEDRLRLHLAVYFSKYSKSFNLKEIVKLFMEVSEVLFPQYLT